MSESANLAFTKVCDIAVNIKYTSKETRELKPEAISKMFFQRNTHSSYKVMQEIKRNKKYRRKVTLGQVTVVGRTILLKAVR